MVKITIDKNAPILTKEEEQEIKDRSVEASPEDFRRVMLGTKEIIISPQVEAQLKAMGMTVDELVAIMLKESGVAQ